MDSSQLPQGSSVERSPITNLPGVYRHDGAGVELITQAGDEGRIQADALVRVGYKRVGDVPSRVELLAMQKKQLVKDLAAEKKAKADEDAELARLVAEEVQKPAKQTAAKK